MVGERALVRAAVSVAALAELAEESAGGGKLEELRQQLVALRVTEAPEGIEDAEEAALALERTIAATPRVASPEYLDAIGFAARRLEQALGEIGSSPFAEAMKNATPLDLRARVRGAGGVPRRAKLTPMEGGFNFPFGGDPEDLMRGLREFAEQQAESVAEAQREQFATLTLNTAVELTAAALRQVDAKGGADEQAIALRDAMRVLFPEAVALVSAARQGFMRETRCSRACRNDAVSSGRAARRAAASSVAPVASGYERSLHPLPMAAKPPSPLLAGSGKPTPVSLHRTRPSHPDDEQHPVKPSWALRKSAPTVPLFAMQRPVPRDAPDQPRKRQPLAGVAVRRNAVPAGTRACPTRLAELLRDHQQLVRDPRVALLLRRGRHLDDLLEP